MPRCKCGRKSRIGRGNPDWKCSFCDEIERQVKKKPREKYNPYKYRMYMKKLKADPVKLAKYRKHQQKYLKKFRERKRKEKLLKKLEQLNEELMKDEYN